jgi:two-component system NtrC family sensor kinase
MVKDDGNINVLLVDDEPPFREAVARRLMKRGFSVDQAGGGEEALQRLDHAPTHVVVLDVKMPDMDGLTTLSRIKEKRPGIEVILLTGQACAQDGVTGIMSGAFDYLTKPVELEHLAGKIRQAFERITWTKDQAREAEFRAKIEQRMGAAERLASLGTMAAGIAHEINNPLAIISEAAGFMNSQILRDGFVSTELRDRLLLALGKIQGSVDRAKRITHQLLGFARKVDWTFETFDLNEMADEVADLTRKTADSQDAKVLVSPASMGAVDVFSDPYQVRQVLINLVTNALQAVGSGGEVRIVVSGTDDQVVVEVKDNGPGIPKENRDRIFEPFFSTKPPGKGTGLGLSVSKSIVDKLGGRIDVDSHLGDGAVFRVILPRRSEPLNDNT